MDELAIERSQDDQLPGRLLLKVSGGMTIEQAAQFREALVAGLAAADDLQVDISGVTRVDLSGLQLLCASHQSAELAGKRFQILNGDNEAFRKVATDAGFQRHIGCSRDHTNSCIWLEEKN
jgi:anti-anti-sigma regulatory factor